MDTNAVEVCRQTHAILVEGTSTSSMQILVADWSLQEIFETLCCPN